MMSIDVFGDVRSNLEKDLKLRRAIFDSVFEYMRAEAVYPPFHSAHEGYAVILEELEELWTEIKKRPDAVSKDLMREEAIQLAAMAIRFLVDVAAE